MAAILFKPYVLIHQPGSKYINYIPRILRIGGCYGFTSKPAAARRPPPAMVLTR